MVHKVTLTLRVTFILCTGALLVVLPGCKARFRETSDFRARIAAANTTQYCHPPLACSNPHILAFESGYLLTSFAGSTPRHEAVHPEELQEKLLALPMSAWPQGAKILISPNDDVMDWQSIQNNLGNAERTCRSLGLYVQLRPGGSVSKGNEKNFNITFTRSQYSDCAGAV